MENIPVEKNKEYIVDIIDNGFEGEGIAKIDGYTIFINGSIKGEKCKILIVKVTKSHGYGKLIDIIDNYIQGIDVDNNNIYLDSDYLLVSGTEMTQNTWMDAKIGDYAVTPRNGKAVEINSMWYNSLMIMANLTNKMGKKTDVRKYKKLAENCKIAFNNRFYNARRKSLYDVLGDSKIRPNQLFAFSLTYPIIEPNSEIANNVINTVEK